MRIAAEFILFLGLTLFLTSSASIAQQKGQINSICLSPDGALLASGNGSVIPREDGMVTIRRVRKAQPIAVLKGHSHAVMNVDFSPDGKLLASASFDNTARLWSVLSTKSVATLRGHTKGLRIVRFSPDGRLLISSGCDRSVKVWEVKSGREIRSMDSGEDAYYVAVSQDGSCLAAVHGTKSGNPGNYITVWNLRSGKKKWTSKGNPDAYTSIIFSRDSAVLFAARTGRQPSFATFDTATGRIVAEQECYAPRTSHLWLSPEANTLLAYYPKMRIIEGATGRPFCELSCKPSAIHAFSSDRRSLALARPDNSIEFIDIAEQALGEKLSEPDHDWKALIADVCSAKSQRAFQAMWLLALSGDQGLSAIESSSLMSLLRDEKKHDWFKQQITRLGDDSHAVRREAYEALRSSPYDSTEDLNRMSRKTDDPEVAFWLSKLLEDSRQSGKEKVEQAVIRSRLRYILEHNTSKGSTKYLETLLTNRDKERSNNRIDDD